MKKIGRCSVCEREVYINDERYCKRCYRDVMLSGQLEEGETAKEQPKNSIIIEDEDETEE